MKRVNAEIRDDQDLTPTPELQRSLYVVQPLPQKIERVRTRAWTSIKSGK
jgi:putrescine transport system substrate-binding protein